MMIMIGKIFWWNVINLKIVLDLKIMICAKNEIIEEICLIGAVNFFGNYEYK